MRRKSFAAFFCVSLCVFSLFSQETRDSEKELEFPTWVYTARRAEIITFGSLPFTTLGVTLVYGTYEYATGRASSFPNPLDKSSSSYDTDEIKKIVGISLGVSGVLALTDFIIGKIKQNRTLAKQKEALRLSDQTEVVPLSDEELKLRRESIIITSELQEEEE